MQNLKTSTSSNLSAGTLFGPKVRECSMKDRERVFFLLGMMFRAGATTENSLRNVGDAFKGENKKDIAQAMHAMAMRVAQGVQLSIAMQAEPVLFHSVHRAAVMAGEASNKMYEAFKTMQTLEKKRMEQSSAGLSELLTPAALAVMSFASLMNTGLNTLPVVAESLVSQGKQVPMLTKTVISIAGWLGENWIFIAAFLFTIIGIVFTMSRTSDGRYWIDYYLLKIPVYGEYLAFKVYSNMLMYFPPMVEAGVKPKQMIPIMEAMADNKVLKSRIDIFNRVLTTGGQMSDAMEKAGFPEIVVTPMRISENYTSADDGVNDVMIEGMHHSYNIIERYMNDIHKRFIGISSVIIWVMGGGLMLTEMLSIMFGQSG